MEYQHFRVDHLGCNTVWTCRQTATFQRNILLIFPDLKMEAVCSYESFVSVYKCSRRYSYENQHEHLHCRANIRSQTPKVYCYVQ
jgi:hypothetical protein